MLEPRPSFEEYNMALAVEVASRSNCLKSHVGAILLHDNRIRAVGYNGTVEGYPDCFDGGCPRCRDMTIGRGAQLDRCVCVHAEENALVSAARYGIEVRGAECYVTHEPCLGCTKLLLQAHISKVVYLNTYEYPDTNDHNASRQAMRERSTGTKFRQFSETIQVDRVEVANERVTVWKERLERMKAEALEYARVKGILTMA